MNMHVCVLSMCLPLMYVRACAAAHRSCAGAAGLHCARVLRLQGVKVHLRQKWALHHGAQVVGMCM